jgi:hypothetical protein
VTIDVDLAPLVDRRIGARPGTASPPVRRRRLRWWHVALGVPGAAIALAGGAYAGGALVQDAAGPEQAGARQMAVFSVSPPGNVCPVLQVCDGTQR